MTSVSPRPLSSVAVVAAAVLIASPVFAQATARWTNPSGGDFATPSNWDVGHPPPQSGTGAFGPDAAYTVTFSANATVTNLVVDTGSPTFDLQGHALTLGQQTGPGSATFGPLGAGVIGVTLLNGTLSLSPFSSTISVGGPAGSTTVLTIGPSAAISGPYGSVNIGGAGIAHVTLNG